MYAKKVHTHTHTHTHIHIHPHTRIHTNIQTCEQILPTYTDIHTHTHTHIKYTERLIRRFGLNNGYRIYVDILTGEKLSSI